VSPSVYLQTALAITLVIASGAKVSRIEQFRSFLQATGLPRSAAQGLSIVVPLIEVTVGLWLAIGVAAAAAAAAVASLSVAFVAAQLIARIRGVDVSCGCFGAFDDHEAGWFSFGRAVLLAAGAAGLVGIQVLGVTDVGVLPFRDPLAATFGVLGGTAFVVVSSLVTKIIYFEARRARPLRFTSIPAPSSVPKVTT
jgi:hypothetical protein